MGIDGRTNLQRLTHHGVPSGPLGYTGTKVGKSADSFTSAQTVLPCRAWRVPQHSVSWATSWMGGPAVADGVGDQFADYQFGGEVEVLQPLGAQLLGDSRPGPGHCGRVGRQVPAGDLAAPEGVGAGQEQGHVVVRASP